MAIPTNTFDTYAAVGNREDLEDKIYMVSPEETPIMSMGFKKKAEAKFHEWQRDTLAAPNKDNAVIEGDDRTGTAITATQRVANYVQLFDKVAIVTSSQRASNPAGRSDEMKYQIMKRTKELKRDVEAMMLSNNPAVAGATGATARKSGGFGVMIYTNALHNGAGATAAHTSGAPTTANTAGTNRAFTEALLKTAMQNVFTNSGTMPTVLALTPNHKTTFSAFTGIAVNRLDLKKPDQAKIIGGADLYVSDFGNLTVVPNYIMATSDTNTAYILNPEYYGIATLQPFSSVPLAKTGHTDKELVSMELCAVVSSETAMAKIDDLTP
jgi:hypothetical protein